MIKIKRFVATLAISFLLTVLLVSPAMGYFRYNAPKSGTFTVAFFGDPETLNGAIALQSVAGRIIANIYSTLICMDYGILLGDGIYGDIAERWTTSPDGLTYTFYLRKGLKWHDGYPLTSADVKYTFDTIVANKYQLNSLLKDAESITTPDNYTLAIKLKAINAAFIPMLAQYSIWYGFILPKHLYEGTDWKNSSYNRNPVGSGPFKFEKWVEGEYVTLVANPDWRGTRPGNPNGPFIDKLVWKIIPDAAVARMALEKGEVDYLYYGQGPTFQEITSFASKPGIRMLKQDAIYDRSLLFNLQKSPFNDSRVREAIAYAVDREQLSSVGLAGLYDPLYYTGCPGTPNWNNYDAVFPRKNLTKANELLQEAGLSRGTDNMRFKTTITSPAFTECFAICEVMKEQLKEVGIDVTWNKYDQATATSKIKAGDFDMCVYYIRYGPDPDAYREHFSTGSWPNLGGQNFMRYSNPKVDELLENARRTLDAEERRSYYFQAQEIIAEDKPYVNLVTAPYYQYVREGWYGTPQDAETYGHTYNWFSWSAVWYEAPPQETVVEKAVLEPWAIYAIVGLVAVIIVEAGAFLYFRRKK